MNINQQVIVMTGASGLLGSHTSKILDDRYLVYAVVRKLPNNPIKGVQYCTVNLSSNWSLSVLPTRVDTIIHLAQSTHFRNFPEKALDIFNVNVNSTAQLLHYAQNVGVRKFIYASSGGVYGNGPGAFHENSPIFSYRDLGYYLGSKVCGEALVQSYASLMNVIIIRPFFMYGSGQRRSMLIPRLVDRIYTGQPIALQGQDGIRINPVHINDAVDLLQACIDLQDSKTINLAGSEVLSIKSISEIIGQKLGISPKFEYVPGKPRDLIGNNDLMLRMLNRPLYPFIEGIKDVLLKGK